MPLTDAIDPNILFRGAGGVNPTQYQASQDEKARTAMSLKESAQNIEYNDILKQQQQLALEKQQRAEKMAKDHDLSYDPNASVPATPSKPSTRPTLGGVAKAVASAALGIPIAGKVPVPAPTPAAAMPLNQAAPTASNPGTPVVDNPAYGFEGRPTLANSGNASTPAAQGVGASGTTPYIHPITGQIVDIPDAETNDFRREFPDARIAQ